MRVEVSKYASRYVEQRGGRVYVWGVSVGRGMVRLRAALERPHGMSFVAVRVGAVEVWLEEELSQWPDDVRVVRSLVPPFGVAAKSAYGDAGWSGSG